MNEIIRLIASHLSQGHRINRVSPIGPASHYTGVTIDVVGQGEVEHKVATASRDEFMDLWKEAGGYLSFHWDDIKVFSDRNA